MAPVIKIKKEDIIDIACNIVRKDGILGINARRIASELGCSIQPIFHNFANMDELKKEVVNKIYDIYTEYIKAGMKNEESYKGIGLAYIKFVKEEPNFFKILFMSEMKLKPKNYIRNDETSENIIKSGQKFSGFSFDEQKRFHFKVWIFTHGLATLVATNTCSLSDEEINEILSSGVKELLNGYRKEQ